MNRKRQTTTPAVKDNAPAANAASQRCQLMESQPLLFSDPILPPAPPPTQGIKYAGSKLKLLPYILDLVKRTGVDSIFDGFSGSTRVGQAFARRGYQVVSNDLSDWSAALGVCYLLNRKEASSYRELIRHLNDLRPVDGWYTKNYGGNVFEEAPNNGIQPDGSKKPWQKKNTRRLDAIRKEIDRLKLDRISRSVALTSLILALDKVDSSLGHFVSYLKDWSLRSFHDLQLEVPDLWVNEQDNTVLQGDVFDALSKANCDLAYYDPPYGSSNEKMPPSRVRYASYYHLWTTILRDDNPNLFGKALRREDSSDKIAGSIFEDFRRNGRGRFIVVEAIERLIKKTQCEWILLSYSSGGRATARELNEVIQDNGALINTVELDYKRNVMASMKWSSEWIREVAEPNREYLFLMKKR